MLMKLTAAFKRITLQEACYMTDGQKNVCRHMRKVEFKNGLNYEFVAMVLLGL
jgi:hypothetical protein